MSLTTADIIAIIQAGGSVSIAPDGSVSVQPVAAKASRADRNRRYYQRLKASESDGNASESVLKRLKASESDAVKTPPSPPPSPPSPPFPRPLTPPAPTPAPISEGTTRMRGEPEEFSLDGEEKLPPKPLPPHKRIRWDTENGFTGISPEELEQWGEAFPACNIPRQLSQADLWLRANPTKRKQNLYRFITNWIGRKQEKGGDCPPQKQNQNGHSRPRPPGDPCALDRPLRTLSIDDIT